MFGDLFYIFFYEAACAIFLPLPSEAPMFMFPNLSRVTVLATCAVGKTAGAWVVFIFGDRLRQSKIGATIVDVMRLRSSVEKLSHWSEKFVNSYGYLGFIFLMSTPGMPMRSTIYSVSVLKINVALFAGGVALGTIIRNSLVWGGYYGLKAIITGLIWAY